MPEACCFPIHIINTKNVCTKPTIFFKINYHAVQKIHKPKTLKPKTENKFYMVEFIVLLLIMIVCIAVLLYVMEYMLPHRDLLPHWGRATVQTPP